MFWCVEIFKSHTSIKKQGFIIPPENLVQMAPTCWFLRSKLIANVNQQHCVYKARGFFQRYFLDLVL